MLEPKPCYSRNVRLFAGTALTLALALFAAPAAQAAKIDCEMKFEMRGWSAFYKTAKGTGEIRCDNGESIQVRISAKGGGLTFGRSKIDEGFGDFNKVDSTDDLFGSYAQAEAHAGAGKSAKASIVTKGEVSLAITGKGQGVDLGVSFGKFTIERAAK